MLEKEQIRNGELKKQKTRLEQKSERCRQLLGKVIEERNKKW